MNYIGINKKLKSESLQKHLDKTTDGTDRLTDKNAEGHDDMTEINSNPPVIRKYRPSFDILRLICVALLVVIEFGLYFIPSYSIVQPFLYFSHGTLFTVYGYNVLRDGADLRKNIRHALKVFLIMLAVYGLLAIGNYWLMTGNPFAGFTKRNIFNFVVLNFWSTSIGSSIWFVQSTLYALIAFWILRKFKKYDWLLCLVLFLGSFLVGEFAGLIHFNFLGYSFIPGNFLTRTMPYMLLGRLIRVHYDEITEKLWLPSSVLFIFGLILSVIEYYALYLTGYLVYSNHFIGFIPMAAILCIRCVQSPKGGQLQILGKCAPALYKRMYYIFNPLGYILLIGAGFICQTVPQYITCQKYMGLAVLILSVGISWYVSFLKELLAARVPK